jgi:hypothetical protein
MRRRGSRIEGKNEPLRSFGIRSSTSPACVASSLGREPSWVGGAGLGAFVAAGADHLGRFHLDQLLEHEAHGIADEVDAVAGSERVEQLGQGRL